MDNKALASLEEAEAMLRRGVDFYNEAPQVDEINLVARVRSLLKDNGLGEDRLVEAYDQNRFVKEAEGRHAHAQQFNLNRYFVDQLSKLEKQGDDSRLLRFQLVYEVRPTEWLKIIEQSIVPNILDKDLPRKD